MKRRVRMTDVRTGALLPQVGGTLRVVKVSPDRQKVTVAYVREPGRESIDLGAKFAGKPSANIYAWDGTGYWRGRDHRGDKHYLTIYRAPQERAQEAAWMARLLRAHGAPNPMQTARRLVRRGMTREQLEEKIARGESYASGDPSRRGRTRRDPGRGEPRQIAFTTDKTRRPTAYYLLRWVGGLRWIRMSYDRAKLLVSEGKAVEVPYIRNPSSRDASARDRRGRSRRDESAYDAIRRAGIPTDHHESDLYVLDTPEARQILSQHGRRYTRFLSNTDRKVWLDVPFAYAPFWARRAGARPGLAKARARDARRRPRRT